MGGGQWLRFLGAAVLWIVVYNGLWLIAWLAFMRGHWTDAMASIGLPAPFGSRFWGAWIAMTTPIGLAVVAYVGSRVQAGGTRVASSTLAASMVMWVPLTAGMVGWAWTDSIPTGVIALDSIVNFGALWAASVVAALGLRGARSDASPRIADEL